MAHAVRRPLQVKETNKPRASGHEPPLTPRGCADKRAVHDRAHRHREVDGARCAPRRRRDAEVGERDGTVSGKQHVGGLDVAVHAAVVVQVVEPPQHVARDRRDGSLGQATSHDGSAAAAAGAAGHTAAAAAAATARGAPLHDRAQAAAGHEGRHHPQLRAAHERHEQRQQARVAQARHQLRLARGLREVGGAGRLEVGALDGDGLAGRAADGALHLGWV